MTRARLLTFREACERLYIPASPGMSPRTVKKFRHQSTRWVKLLGANPSIGAIERQHFVTFRAAGLKAELSPASIEDTISDVLTILRYAVDADILDKIPSAGKRLRRRPAQKRTPSLADISAVYRKARLAEWPMTRSEGGRPARLPQFWKTAGYSPAKCVAQWWRTWLAVLYFTGLRRGDSLTLRWDEIKSGRIVRTMAKTGFNVELPVHPVLRAHLDKLPRVSDLILGCHRSPKQQQRELRRLCKAAKVEHFTAQGMRRASARAWERARGGCGTLITGHRHRGSDAFYLDPFECLLAAVPALEVPDAMAGRNAKPAAKSGKASQGNPIADVLSKMDRADAVKALMEALAAMMT